MRDIRVSADEVRYGGVEGKVYFVADGLVQLFWVGDTEV